MSDQPAPFADIWGSAVSAIVSAAVAAEANEVLSYQRLSEIAGVSLTSQHPAMARALREALRSGVVLENIPSVGYRKIVDAEVVRASGKGMRKVYRASRRVVRRLKTVTVENLSPTDATTHYARLSALRMIGTKAHGNSSKPTRLSLQSDALRYAVRYGKNREPAQP